MVIIDSLPRACDRLCCTYDLLYHLIFLIGSNEKIYLPWKFDSPQKSIHLVLWKVRFHLLQVADVCKAVFPLGLWSSVCHQSPWYVHYTVTRWAGSKLADILQLVLLWLEWSESYCVLQVPGLLTPFLGCYSKVSSSSASKCCFCPSLHLWLCSHLRAFVPVVTSAGSVPSSSSSRASLESFSSLKLPPKAFLPSLPSARVFCV